MRFILIVALAVGVGVSAVGFEIPLEYVPMDSAQNTYTPYGMRLLTEVADPEEWAGVRVPVLHCATPVRYKVSLNGKTHWLILDKRAPGDEHLTRVLFDANANGDLTDDQQLVPDFSVVFGPFTYQITVDIPITSREKGDSLEFSSLCQRGEYAQVLNPVLRSSGSYRGEFVLEGRSHTLWLVDGNVNGSYSDWTGKITGRSYSTVATGDYLYIAEGRPISHHDVQFLSPYVVLYRTTYAVEVSTADRVIKLTPQLDGLTRVQLSSEPELLTLIDEDAAAGVMMFRPGKSPDVPPGSYKVAYYQVLGRGALGDQWTACGVGKPETPAVKVALGKLNPVKFGEPYTPCVRARNLNLPVMPSGDKAPAQLEFYAVGQASEEIAYLAMVRGTPTKIQLSQRNPTLPSEPTYKIIASDGEVVTAGRFEYG